MGEEASGYAEQELGPANSIRADALGEPGQRQFRLLVEAQGGSAVLWLEKEQLFQLGVAIKRLLMVTSKEEEPQQLPTLPEASLQENSFDFKVGKLAIGHDSESHRFILLAHDTDAAAEERSATLSCWANWNQVDELADEAFKVCAAGRPRCALCGAPLEPEPHTCPRSNGHVILQE